MGFAKDDVLWFSHKIPNRTGNVSLLFILMFNVNVYFNATFFFFLVFWQLLKSCQMKRCIRCFFPPKVVLWTYLVQKFKYFTLLWFGNVFEAEQCRSCDTEQKIWFNLNEFITILATHIAITAIFIRSMSFRWPKIIGQLLTQMFLAGYHYHWKKSLTLIFYIISLDFIWQDKRIWKM